MLRPPFSETFSPALPAGLNLGAQLNFQKEAFPAAFARVRSILTYPQYWAFRLTGVQANEVTSLGCHTDLWQPTEGRYSSLVDKLGLDSLLAPIRSPFDRLGHVTPGLARDIGLAGEVDVFCGIHDSNASLLPHLMRREPPFTVVSTGTWVVCFAVGGSFDRLDPTKDTLANVDAYGRAVPSSRFMGGREFELLAGELGPCDPYAALLAMPAVISRGMMLQPSASASAAPASGFTKTWTADAGASPQERWAAALLYLALMTEVSLERIGAKGPVLVEGPFAANAGYLHALRALLHRPVIAIEGTTGTSQGAGCLAGVHVTPKGREIADDPSLSDVEHYRDAWRGAAVMAMKQASSAD